MSARNMDDIAEVIKALRFQKKLIGGVSEKSVWKQLEKLQKEYQSAYDSQEERFKALLQERDEEIASLKKQISQGPAHEQEENENSAHPGAGDSRQAPPPGQLGGYPVLLIQAFDDGGSVMDSVRCLVWNYAHAEQ